MGLSEVFAMSSEVIGLIKTVLVLGTSSADVERLFSIMVSFKYSQMHQSIDFFLNFFCRISLRPKVGPDLSQRQWRI